MNTTYDNQKLRGLKRRIELINYLGGKCCRCGYDKSIAALEFHHRDPESKSFSLDMRKISGKSMDELKEEADKCDLVCSNCHKEIHYSHLNKDNIEDTLNGIRVEIMKKKSPAHKSKYICECCGKPFKAVTKKRFCCAECREKSKNYPPIEELRKKYEELKSWQKVAEFYSLGRSIIRRIRRKAGDHC